MVDGLDVLFRVALAILRGNERELLDCDSLPAVYVALESLPNRMWRSDKLLKVRCLPSTTVYRQSDRDLQREVELRSVLVHSDIVKRREAHTQALRDISHNT